MCRQTPNCVEVNMRGYLHKTYGVDSSPPQFIWQQFVADLMGMCLQTTDKALEFSKSPPTNASMQAAKVE